MHCDAKGLWLEVGDKVLIPATITSIQDKVDYCNLSVELDILMPPNGNKVTFSAINTKQVFKTNQFRKDKKE